MEQLIKMVADKTGISEAQATTAVNTVVGFLKDKMPAGLGSQLDSLMKGGTGSMTDMADSLKDKIGDKIGGMFGK